MFILLFLFLVAAPLFAAGELGVRLVLGLTDKAETKWDGSVTARGARVAAIEPWRFEGKDAVLPGNAWRASTHPIRRFGGGAAPAPAVVGNGVILRLTEWSESAELDVKTAEGNFIVRLSEIPYGKMTLALAGRVMADRIPPVTQLTESAEEQDYPAMAMGGNGDIWLAWVEFKHHREHNRLRALMTSPPEKLDDWKLPAGGDQIFARRYAAGRWESPVAITQGGEDLYRPAVAVDGQGRPWVFWSANEKDNFDIWARVIEGGQPAATVRVSNAPGSDIDPAAATDSSGRVWVAWQAWRKGKASILAASQTAGGFSAPVTVASSGGNEWNPAIAAGAKGRVTVAWDSYRNGNYDVFTRTHAAGKWGAETAVAASARYEAYPSLAYAPDGRLWIAYEEGSERWGKDFGADESTGIALYQGRAIRLRGIEPDGRLVEPKADIGAVLPGIASQRVDSTTRQNESGDWFLPRPEAWKKREPHRPTQIPVGPKNSYPRLHVDSSGRLWVAVRSNHPFLWNPIGTVWSEHVVSYDGEQWAGPVFLSRSDNLLDNRPAVLSPAPGELLVVGSSDWRREFHLSERRALRGGQVVADPYNNDLFASHIKLAAGSGKLAALAATPEKPAGLVPADAAERKQIAAIRAARVQGKYRVLQGEFHRHSEISGDGGSDGSIIDQWRYIIDAADMDWAGCCDHDNGGGREYSWWITQKLTDIFHAPGRVVPMFSYERSVSYPEGHRNVIFAQRGVRTLPRLPKMADDSAGKAPDTLMLYRYLRQFNGIVAVHTSGTNMGTDWRDNDPVAEPVVEIYQGLRQNYERPDAPRTNKESDSIGGWRPKGFVNLALEMGHKLAFQSSSDHISTHMSYCNVLATDTTREAVLEAFQKRRVYGATDNILAEFTSGAHLMGEEFSTAQPPQFRVRLSGTAPFAKVHVIKNNEHVYTAEPKRAQVDFTWRDNTPTPGKVSYYYVRGVQGDGEIVWVSPMWITYTGE